MLLEILSIIAPIFFIAALGFVWSHLKLRYDPAFVASIVTNVGAPCLILSVMIKVDVSETLLTQLIGIVLSGLALLLILNSLLLKVTGGKQRTYLGPLTFANTGNMGVPISMFAFGQTGEVIALMYFMVTSLVHFSLGVAIVGGKNPLKMLFTSPICLSAFLSLAIVFADVTVPKAVFNTLDLLGGIAIPLMIFSLGASLHDLSNKAMFKSLFYGASRLIVGLLVGLLICFLFQLEGVLRGVVLIQACMPSAVFNYLLAANYQRQPSDVAGVVVSSTLLSFLSLPLLLWFVLEF